ncbi:HTH_48 domain-containing protein [Trichonephila clavipes]|nr:HTH_48 domain-containing protein [Trichonephila clavipes]
MESDKQHFRHILLFYYRKGKNAAQARKKLTDVYGEGVLTVRQCQNWFAKFRSGNFDVEDAPLYDHLKGLGFSSKFDVWVPHVLTGRNLCRRIDVCDSLLKCHENDPFFEAHHHWGRKRSWRKKDEPTQTISKANIYQKKTSRIQLLSLNVPAALRLIEDETFNDNDIINNLIDYERGQEARFFESG